MLDRLKSFFASLGEKHEKQDFRADDPRVAAAALMLHVVEADGISEESEREKMREVLAQSYGLSGRDLEKLVQAADDAHRESVDLFSFTTVLNRKLDATAKIEFIGILWEMVYADGELHELEDNTVWRVAELIGVESRDRVRMRQDVRARHGAAANGPED